MAETVRSRVLRDGMPWRRLSLLDTVDSTNAELRRTGDLGDIVVAERQSAGRGRLGRTWETTPGTSLAVSVLVPIPPSRPGWVPLLTGLATARAITRVTGLDVALKWPNDVLAPSDEDRKVAGILCELTPRGIIIGVGINVDHRRDELPVDTATSLRLAGASERDRTDLLVAHLDELARVLAAAHGEKGRSAAIAAYRQSCSTIAREIDLHSAGTVARVLASGVDDEGRLVVTDGSRSWAVAAGDVTHVRPTVVE